MKIGSFNYKKFKFNNEPFYVGKGFGNRYKVHIQTTINEWKHDHNHHKINRIKKIIRNKMMPIVIFFKENLSENDALKRETNLIQLIGRWDLKTGPLLNLTNGGELPTLNKWSIKKMRDAKLGKFLLDVTKKKMRQSHLGMKNHFFGKTHSEKTKLLISKHRKGKFAGVNHPMFGKTHTNKVKKILSEFRKTIVGEKHPRSRKYELTSPTGEITIFCGAFDKNCKKLGISSPVLLRHVAQGIRDNYNGWKCKYII